MKRTLETLLGKPEEEVQKWAVKFAGRKWVLEFVEYEEGTTDDVVWVGTNDGTELFLHISTKIQKRSNKNG